MLVIVLPFLIQVQDLMPISRWTLDTIRVATGVLSLAEMFRSEASGVNAPEKADVVRGLANTLVS